MSASWSTPDARWTVEAVAGEERQTWTCSALYACTGYYDHGRGYTPDFPGLADFRGRCVHPQRWPEDLDLAGRRVVVIGSGATAVTLVPALADAGADVTMLQRSPSWVTSVGGPDPVRRLLAHLPHRVADPLLRTRNAATTIAFYRIAQRRPALARWYLRRGMASVVGDEAVDAHFTPRYDPWDQRLCVAPGGDFLHTVADGRAQIVTDHVERFEADGIRLASGRAPGGRRRRHGHGAVAAGGRRRGARRGRAARRCGPEPHLPGRDARGRAELLRLHRLRQRLLDAAGRGDAHAGMPRAG